MNKQKEVTSGHLGNIRDVIAEDDGSSLKAVMLRMGATEEEAEAAAMAIAKESAERLKQRQQSSVA